MTTRNQFPEAYNRSNTPKFIFDEYVEIIGIPFYKGIKGYIVDWVREDCYTVALTHLSLARDVELTFHESNFISLEKNNDT